MKLSGLFAALFAVLTIFASCSERKYSPALAAVDSLIARDMDDSARIALSRIGAEGLKSGGDMAYYNMMRVELVFRSGKVLPDDSLINSCIAYFKENGDSRKLAWSYYFRGRLQFKRDEVKEAVMSLKMAERTANETDDNLLKSRIYVSLSYFNGRQGEFRIGLKYAKAAIKPTIACGDTTMLALLYQNMGAKYGNLEYEDSMVYYFEKCEPLLKGVHGKKGRAGICITLGSMYKNRGDLKKARQYIMQAMEAQPEADTYYILSDLCRREGDTARADSLRRVALGMADGHYRLMILTRMWREKSELGQYKEANMLADELNALRDTLARQERTDSLREKQSAFDTATISDVRLRRTAALAQTSAWAAIAIAAALAMAILHILRRRRALATIRKEARNEIDSMLKTNNELKEKISGMTKAIKSLKVDNSDRERMIASLKVQLSCFEKKSQKAIQTASKQNEAYMNEFIKEFIDVFMLDKSIVLWDKMKLARFVMWCRASLTDADKKIEYAYGQLTDRNCLIVLMLHMNKNKEQICHVMGISESSYRKAISRLGKRVKPENDE